MYSSPPPGAAKGTDTLWLVVAFAGLRFLRHGPLLRLVIKGGVPANCRVPFAAQISHRGSGLRCYFIACKITTPGVITHTPCSHTSRLVGGSRCASRQEGGDAHVLPVSTLKLGQQETGMSLPLETGNVARDSPIHSRPPYKQPGLWIMQKNKNNGMGDVSQTNSWPISRKRHKRWFCLLFNFELSTTLITAMHNVVSGEPLENKTFILRGCPL